MSATRDRDGEGPRSADAAAHSHATDITSYLISGPVAFGLIGYALDRWWGTGFCVPVGIIVGFVLSLYVVWVRYGRA
ncbi:AtpZ/AtpI family protein [Arsenicicoccus sp. oral taxon 190]|uniref:AtpZ/AtpI family protein n=1 Tax=Arsenicicoccus sp. oral taxon 190 TaxID=1658671 RepID=UPI000679F300|nr:AtpZ/AtpI family protein [Arsenicicoccus sp. oral taxon 190]AKT52371.1 hypothetical protein ADJ73_15790 [Arsenicicoccus sp. oral taxon 190]